MHDSADNSLDRLITETLRAMDEAGQTPADLMKAVDASLDEELAARVSPLEWIGLGVAVAWAVPTLGSVFAIAMGVFGNANLALPAAAAIAASAVYFMDYAARRRVQ